MTTTEQQTPPVETVRDGRTVYDELVKPRMRPEDDGKFVAVDRLTGEYELDKDEVPAILRLQARMPGAKVWLGCVGQLYTYRI